MKLVLINVTIQSNTQMIIRTKDLISHYRMIISEVLRKYSINIDINDMLDYVPINYEDISSILYDLTRNGFIILLK